MSIVRIVSALLISSCIASTSLAASTAGPSKDSIRFFVSRGAPAAVCLAEGKISGSMDKESTVNVDSSKCDTGAFRIQSPEEASELLRDRSNAL
jgi:hypothetical protein